MTGGHELPDCDEIWARYFARWYQPDDLAGRGYSATRPDAERSLLPGTPARAASSLTDAGVSRVRVQLDTMLTAVLADWPTYLNVDAPLDILWIQAFDTHWTRPRVHELLGWSDPTDFSNELVVLACEFGVALGEVMRAACPQLQWLYEWPYWESGLLDVPTGYRINVFDWGIKRFSEYERIRHRRRLHSQGREGRRTCWCRLGRLATCPAP